MHMKKIIYSFPNVRNIIRESESIVTKIDTDTFETEVFYHPPTGAIFCFAGYPGEYGCDASAPFIELYGTRRASKKLEMALCGEKIFFKRLLSRISHILLSYA